jgi:hypothetical protein
MLTLVTGGGSIHHVHFCLVMGGPYTRRPKAETCIIPSLHVRKEQ